MDIKEKEELIIEKVNELSDALAIVIDEYLGRYDDETLDPHLKGMILIEASSILHFEIIKTCLTSINEQIDLLTDISSKHIAMLNFEAMKKADKDELN